MSSRRPWSKSEDEKLITLIEHFGDRRGRDSKWQEISRNLPGRTNKDCRKRWFHSLDPSLRKGRWTKEEDKLLLDAYQHIGPAWKEIALLIKGRKDDQCAKRYNDILNPRVQNRLKVWTPEEDQYLAAKVKELGHKWTVIAAGLPGRPPLTCRNRWRKLARNLCSDIGHSQEDSPIPQSSTENSMSSWSCQASEIFFNSTPDTSSDLATIDISHAHVPGAPLAHHATLPSDSSLLDLAMNQLNCLDYLQSTPASIFHSPQLSPLLQYQVPGVTNSPFTPENERTSDPVPQNTFNNEFAVTDQGGGNTHQIHSPRANTMLSSALEEASVQQALSSFIQHPTSEIHIPAASSMQHQEHHHIHHVHIHHHYHHQHYNY